MEPPPSSDSASHYDIPYDMSLIPDTRLLFPPQCPSVAPTSPAKTIPKIEGIYSHDPLLDHSPEELWRFLASHLQSPDMAVRIVGTHKETTTRGSGSRSTTSSRTVTDFSIQLDVSRYVNPQWSRILTKNPSRTASNRAPTPTVRETLEEYAGSKNAFKEFRLRKFVKWDYKELVRALTELVRSAGYRSKVTITFPMQDYKVVALASNQYNKAAHSEIVRVLCVMSCLCLVFWPAWAMARKRINRLVCVYGMAASGEVFYARNRGIIYNTVALRLRQDSLIAW